MATRIWRMDTVLWRQNGIIHEWSRGNETTAAFWWIVCGHQITNSPLGVAAARLCYLCCCGCTSDSIWYYNWYEKVTAPCTILGKSLYKISECLWECLSIQPEEHLCVGHRRLIGLISIFKICPKNGKFLQIVLTLTRNYLQKMMTSHRLAPHKSANNHLIFLFLSLSNVKESNVMRVTHIFIVESVV